MEEILAALPTLVRLARTGSVSATADALGVPRSTVSRRLSRLEDALGVPLAERTTRSFRLTPAGQLLVERAGGLLAQFHTLCETVASTGGSVRGTLRVAAPPGLSGPFVGVFLRAFQGRFPQVRIDFVVSERRPHLLDEGFDVVLANGPLEDLPWVRHRLGQSWYLAVASPKYLAAAGTPATAADLAGHALLAPRLPGLTDSRWPRLDGPPLAIAPQLASNDLASVRAAALEGMGIALLPVHLLIEDLATEALVPVLPAVIGQALEIYALYAEERRGSPLIRALLDDVDAFASTQQAPKFPG